MTTAVVAALASAFCFALAAALQHREALSVNVSGIADLRLLSQLGRRPLWLAGVGCDIVSMALHVVALSLATLAVVQPLGVTGIVFAIPLAAVLRRQRIRGAEIAAAAAVALGLIVLLRCLPTSSGVHAPSPALVVGSAVAAAALMAAATTIAHFRPGRPRAILLALGAGVAFGLTAALVRTLIRVARQPGIGSTVVAVAICIAGLGLGGYLLLQSAYRSGHFAASLATATVLDPMVAVLAGAVLLREELPTAPVRLAVIGLAVLLIGAGIGLLVRSPAIVTLAPRPAAPGRDETEPAADRPLSFTDVGEHR